MYPTKRGFEYDIVQLTDSEAQRQYLAFGLAYVKITSEEAASGKLKEYKPDDLRKQFNIVDRMIHLASAQADANYLLAPPNDDELQYEE